MIPIYNLIEYRNNYSKTSRILWQYCRDEPVLNNDDTTDVNAKSAIPDLYNCEINLILTCKLCYKI